MTLLELIVASTLMTGLVVAVAMLLRGGASAWQAHEGDLKKIEAAQATVRHIVRQVRQAQAVTAVSSPAVSSGTLTVQTPSGALLVWAHDGVTKLVSYGVTTATNVLSDQQLEELRFTGYKADGVTTTSVPGEVQLLKVSAVVALPRDTGGSRTISSWAWVRCW